MLSEDFIDFVKKLFPNIDPFVEAQTRASLKQFASMNQTSVPMLTSFSEDEINQGDILTNIPFYKIGEDGEFETVVTNGIVISNSCDIENDENILIAPMLDLGQMDPKLIEAIKQNTIYGKIYFPENNKFVGDFSLIQTFPKKMILDAFSEKKIQKLYSLNLIGFYFLICKLTVHLLRPENEGVQSERKSKTEY